MNAQCRGLLIANALGWMLAIPAQNVPRFEAYVESVYSGPTATPSLAKPEERRYRTAIMEGVRKGYGVFEGAVEQERPGPNFAGHYIVIQWGCGTDCLKMAVVDAKTAVSISLL
jgi:hypothetical protein